jgi:hypothetical protein
MKICYIILTCEKYIPTRCEAVRKTWLKHVEHYYFLSSVPNPSQNILGWNTPDDYDSCSLKYIEFFKNETLDYDWYVFCDDDTFVFPDRISDYLKQLNPNESFYIGYEFPGMKPPGGLSGGAGFVLSRESYSKLCEHVRGSKNIWVSTYTDVSMRIWLLERMQGVKKIVDYRFHPSKCTSDMEFRTAFTFHYVTPEEMIVYDSKKHDSNKFRYPFHFNFIH